MASEKSLTLALLGNNEGAIAAIEEVEEKADALKASTSDLVIGADSVEATEQVSALDKALADYKVAAAEAADAQSTLTDLQKSGSASAAELAAANADVTATTKTLKDAQLELGQAELASGDESAVAAARAEESAGKQDAAAVSIGGVATKFGLAGLAVAAVGGVFTDMAAKFQDSTTHLVTDAGETAANLGMVQQGILQVASATGTSANDATNAMYHIESGGFHGAAGLALLKTAAEGAKVGGADLDTVSRVLVGTMNAYGMSSKNAATQQRMANQMMNEMIATVGSGDMRMQDLASSMSAVAPLAAAVGIKFSQVGGAIATMTAQGMSAQQSTQDLANTIRALSNPNSVAIAEMNQLGINSQNVSKNLGKEGLTGTIGMLSNAVLSNMGPSGEVLLKTFTQSQSSGRDLQEMLNGMPASVRKLATEFQAGSITSQDWTNDIKAATPANAELMTQFKTLYDRANSFNSAIAAGGNASQTYTAAMAKIMGGATGLNTALMLTGKNASVFNANAATIQKASDSTTTSVNNWSTIQGTLSFQLDKAKDSAENLGISIGLKLLPAATDIIRVLASFAGWLGKYPTEVAIAIAVIIGLAGAFGVLKLAMGIKAMFDGVAEGITFVKEACTGLVEAIPKVVEGMQALDLSFLANPITLIIIAIVALVAGFVLLWTHCAAFRDFWKDAWRDIEGAAVAVWHGMEAVWHGIVSGLSATLDWVKSNWKLVAAWLLDPIGMAVYEIRTHTHQIAEIFDEMRHDVMATLDTGRHDIAAFADWVPREFVQLWDNARHGTAAMLDAIRQDLVSAFDKFVQANVTMAKDVFRVIEAMPGRIKGFLQALPGDMLTIGRNVIDGLIHGIESGASDIPSVMKGLASNVESYFTNPLKIFSPSRVFMEHGENIVQGLALGITGNAGIATGAVTALARGVSSAGNAALVARAGAGSSAPLQIEWIGGQGDQEFMTWLKKNVRIRGGNPNVLGR